MSMLKKLDQVIKERNHREKLYENRRRRDRLYAAFIAFFSDLPIRIIGAIAGFFIGCVMLALLYIVLQFFAGIFDISRISMRIPVVVLILPLVVAFFGFKLAPSFRK